MFREVVLFTVLTHSLLKAFVLGQFFVFTRVNCKIDYCIQGNIHPFRPRCHRANSISQIISVNTTASGRIQDGWGEPFAIVKGRK